MGSVQFGIPRDKTLALKAKYGLVDFVETGTLVGHTSMWAAEHFAHVTTVDIEERLEVRETTFPYKNISLNYGDSGEFLEKLPVWAPTLFWLDAHTNESCPVMREIAAVNKLGNFHVVMVDDVNQFGVLQNWPTKAEAITALEDGGRRTVHEFEDVFIAEPCP